MFYRLSKAYRSLHLFSGEDYHIIQKLNDSKINRSFNFIGLCVMMISLLCLFSAGIFMFNILEGAGRFMSIPIGLFWGFTVTTIYILLLYTITPPLLIDRSMTSKRKKKFFKKSINFNNAKKIGEWLTFSMVLRLLFILVFAVIIAQPFNVLFFGKLIQPDIETYKMRFKADMILNSDSIKIAEEQKLHDAFYQKLSVKILSKSDSIQRNENLIQIDEKINNDSEYLVKSFALKNSLEKLENKFDKQSIIKKEKQLAEFHQLAIDEINSDSKFLSELREDVFTNPEIQIPFKEYSEKVRIIIEEKNVFNEKTVKLIDGNNFYVRRIVILNSKTAQSNILNIISLALFIFPIYLKFSIRKVKRNEKEVFYRFKEEYERKLVIENYLKFKDNFENTLTIKNKNFYNESKQRLTPILEKLERIDPQITQEIKEDIQKRYDRSFNFYEKYLDPPFNLMDKKKNIIESSERLFIGDLWQYGNE